MPSKRKMFHYRIELLAELMLLGLPHTLELELS
jgi:hypothetical protein